MAKVHNSGSSEKGRIRPAINPDARENQLVSLAVDLAQKQLMDGTASSQVISHFLKIGSTRSELEKERLVQENRLLQAKTEALQSEKRVEELYDKAIKAMKNYGGYGDPDEYEY